MDFVQIIRKKDKKIDVLPLKSNAEGNYELEEPVGEDHLIAAVFIDGKRASSPSLLPIEQLLCQSTMSVNLLEDRFFHNLDRKLEIKKDSLISSENFKSGAGGDDDKTDGLEYWQRVTSRKVLLSDGYIDVYVNAQYLLFKCSLGYVGRYTAAKYFRPIRNYPLFKLSFSNFPIMGYIILKRGKPGEDSNVNYIPFPCRISNGAVYLDGNPPFYGSIHGFYFSFILPRDYVSDKAIEDFKSMVF